jgi:hypothetical protein
MIAMDEGGLVNWKGILESQYRASAKMLRSAVEACPDSLWNDKAYENRLWHVAFHTIFYTHFYLHSRADSFVPWEKHNDDLVSLGESSGDEIYTKEEILEYLGHFEEKLNELVDALDLEAILQHSPHPASHGRIVRATEPSGRC